MFINMFIIFYSQIALLLHTNHFYLIEVIVPTQESDCCVSCIELVVSFYNLDIWFGNCSDCGIFRLLFYYYFLTLHDIPICQDSLKIKTSSYCLSYIHYYIMTSFIRFVNKRAVILMSKSYYHMLGTHLIQVIKSQNKTIHKVNDVLNIYIHWK